MLPISLISQLGANIPARIQGKEKKTRNLVEGLKSIQSILGRSIMYYTAKWAAYKFINEYYWRHAKMAIAGSQLDWLAPNTLITCRVYVLEPNVFSAKGTNFTMCQLSVGKFKPMDWEKSENVNTAFIHRAGKRLRKWEGWKSS